MTLSDRILTYFIHTQSSGLSKPVNSPLHKKKRKGKEREKRERERQREDVKEGKGASIYIRRVRNRQRFLVRPIRRLRDGEFQRVSYYPSVLSR